MTRQRRDLKGKIKKVGQRAKGEKRKGSKRSPAIADKAKTNIVVVVVAPIIVVANRRAAIIRIVVPRTAPKSGSPTPSSIPRKYKGTEYLLS